MLVKLWGCISLIEAAELVRAIIGRTLVLILAMPAVVAGLGWHSALMCLLMGLTADLVVYLLGQLTAQPCCCLRKALANLDLGQVDLTGAMGWDSVKHGVAISEG